MANLSKTVLVFDSDVSNDCRAASWRLCCWYSDEAGSLRRYEEVSDLRSFPSASRSS